MKPLLTSPILTIPDLSDLTNLLLATPITHPIALLALFALGVTLGSFLNVVILRNGTQHTIQHPKRSFCHNCKTELSWKENIPLLSYLAQMGRCKHCKVQISTQYPLVELFYGIAFLFLWANSSTILQFSILSIFCSCAGAAALIDAKTFQLPDSLTLGGTLAILTLCLPFPDILAHQTTGALAGFLITAAIYSGGKLFLGQKRISLQKPSPTKWVSTPSETWMQLSEDETPLEESEKIEKKDIFEKPTDTITLEGKFKYSTKNTTETNPTEEPKTCKKIVLHPTHVFLPETEETFTYIQFDGVTYHITHPITPMGWGDVKLMALCGSALGAWGAFHALTLGACLGLLFTLLLRVRARLQKQNAPELIAFGPWITLAAFALLCLK